MPEQITFHVPDVAPFTYDIDTASQTGYGRGQTNVILLISYYTFIKTFPDIRSIEAIEFIKSTYPKFISF